MKIEPVQWLEGYNVDMDKLYTELTLEKIENEPAGPRDNELENYQELFVKKESAAEDNQRTQESKSEKVPGEKILFKGDPGMGKTTISRKITWDWAVGLFKTFVIVFLVYLKFVRPGDSIENVIIGQTPVLQEKTLNVTEKRMKQILEIFGNRILVILDGLDEHALGKNRDVEAILKGRKYLYCNFLLTSRPHSIRNVEEYFQTVVRVDGFTLKEARKFASNLLNNNLAKTEAVLYFNPNGDNTDKKPLSWLSVLKSKPLYRCPILLSFLCILSREENIDLSGKTIDTGEIYTRMVLCLYKKFTIRKGIDFDNQSFMKIVRSVGKLAYEMLLSENYLLKRSDIIREVGQLAFDIGLFIGHEDFRLIRDETADIFVTFPHRSLQEFLGAFYFIFMLNEEIVMESSENVSRKVSKGNQNCDVGCARPFSSILSDQDLFILKNPLFFHFCLWLLCSGQTYVSFQNIKDANIKLTEYIVDKIDVCQCDLKNIVNRFPVLNFQNIHKEKDGTMLKFLENILIRCQRIEHLVAGHTYPAGRILELVDCEISSVVFIDNISFPPHYAAPSTKNDIRIVFCKVPSVHEVIKLSKSSRKHSTHIYLNCRINFDQACLFGEWAKEIHVIGPSNTSIESVSFTIHDCPFLTHLSLIHKTIGLHMIEVLSKAVEGGKLPVLSHLSFENSILPFTFQKLFKLKWPSLTHLNIDCRYEFGWLESFPPEGDTSLLTQDPMPNLSSCIVSDEFLFRYFFSEHHIFSIRNLTVTTTKPHHAIEALNDGKYPDLENLSISKSQTGYYTRCYTGYNELDTSKIPWLKSLKLSHIISSINDLTNLKVNVKQWNIIKLDISYSSGITGNLSVLLDHSFPSLNSLILSDCGLNSQDLCSLAQASVEGRLPHLMDLDISCNPDILNHLDSLYSDSCTWNQLLSFSVNVWHVLSLCPSFGINFLSQRAEVDGFKSLQKLSFSVLENRNLSITTCWSCLHTVHVSVHMSKDAFEFDMLRISPILESLANAVDQGFLPLLRAIYLCSDTEPDDNPIDVVQRLRHANICIYHSYGNVYDLK